MGSDTEKKQWTNIQNSYKNWSKEIKSDNFCYRKVGRAITKWGAIEKSTFLNGNKIISHFMVAIIFSSTVGILCTLFPLLAIIFIWEKGITTLRIYQYWVVHRTMIEILFYYAKIPRTQEIRTFII